MKPVSENRSREFEAQWEKRIAELKSFKQINGHCNPPLKGETKELAKWLMNQRYYYKSRLEGKKNSLTQERIKTLEDVRIT